VVGNIKDIDRSYKNVMDKYLCNGLLSLSLEVFYE
jgi:hypothetical protein